MKFRNLAVIGAIYALVQTAIGQRQVPLKVPSRNICRPGEIINSHGSGSGYRPLDYKHRSKQTGKRQRLNAIARKSRRFNLRTA